MIKTEFDLWQEYFMANAVEYAIESAEAETREYLKNYKPKN